MSSASSARAEVLYPATLVVRSYFIVCLVAFYWMSRDPMFFVIIGVVVLGMALTLTSHLRDRKEYVLPECAGC
jgi:hypothetical protein